jgi:hypothetical protein
MIANVYLKLALAAALLLGRVRQKEKHTRTKDKEHNKYNEHEMQRVLYNLLTAWGWDTRARLAIHSPRPAATTQRRSTRTRTTSLQLHEGRITTTTR